VAGTPRGAGGRGGAGRDGHDLDAREDMALASLWSGMALANAGLGAVHGFAGPLGGMLGAPHGALCAALLPHVMAANVAALRRASRQGTVARFEHVARLLTGASDATADDGIGWVRTLCADLGIAGLGPLGISARDRDRMVPAARRASSMAGNPVVLGDDELASILASAT
jgi:alcohol dehydrogenase class IV